MSNDKMALFALLLSGCQAAHAEESVSSTAEASDSSVVGQIARMNDVEDIRQLKARYFRCMDEKDWDCFAATLDIDVDFNVSGTLYACKNNDPNAPGLECDDVWPSGEMTFNPSDPTDFTNNPFWQRNGRDSAVAFERGALELAQTMHQGHMPEITLTSPTTAKAKWTLTHHLVFPPGAQVPGLFPDNGRDRHELFGYGYYDEEYVKRAEGWRISKLRFTSFRVEIH